MTLHYGDPQIAIGLVFAVIAVLLAIAFVVIGVQAGSDVSVERVHKEWATGCARAGLPCSSCSAWSLWVSRCSTCRLHGAAGPGSTVVKVTSGQFFWSLSPDQVPAGTRVRFDVSSIDVNHGFALHDPHGHLIGSVQAMPGYNNELDLTFTEAGVYQIRCFEFCGLNHSTMEGSFTVTRR